MTTTAPDPPARDPFHPIIAFDGAITTRLIPHPHRAFAYEVTFQLQHPQLVSLSTQKPPLHFHPYQDEYIQVLEGRLCLEIEGWKHVLEREDGEARVEAWAHHRLYPPPTGDGGAVTRFLLGGAETDQVYMLDTVFFQNWYGYQDEVVMGSKRMDLIQVLCMFDAGASYLSVPWWVPFGRSLSRTVGIVVGRWVGGMLGYQPFYRKWTTDWGLACEKMETSFFQRRFADRAKTE